MNGMVPFEPDGGDEGNKVARVCWQSVRNQGFSSRLKEFGKRLSTIDVQCTALDTTPLNIEVSGGEP
jgi:hypothetical protein